MTRSAWATTAIGLLLRRPPVYPGYFRPGAGFSGEIAAPGESFLCKVV